MFCHIALPDIGQPFCISIAAIAYTKWMHFCYIRYIDIEFECQVALKL